MLEDTNSPMVRGVKQPLFLCCLEPFSKVPRKIIIIYDNNDNEENMNIQMVFKITFEDQNK